MAAIPGLSRPLGAAGKHITFWDDSGSRLIVETSSTVRWAACLGCAGRGSPRPHGPTGAGSPDSPCFGKPMALTIEVRRFKRIDYGCSQRTFSERIETLAVPGWRRTLRLAEAPRSLDYAFGGEAAARLAACLGLPHQRAYGAARAAQRRVSTAADRSHRHRHR